MKKGFTLVEILGSMIILSLLLLIAIPTVNGILNKVENDLYNTQINNIISSAKAWAIENADIMPDTDKKTITVFLGTLKNDGLVEFDLTNPKTQKPFSDSVEIVITYNEDYKEYEYLVRDE